MIVVNCETLIFKRYYRVTVHRGNPKQPIWQTYVRENYDMKPLYALITGLNMMGTGLSEVLDVPEPEYSKELEGG